MLDNLLLLPIALYLVHYIYSFYRHFYKTNRNTMHTDELISNFVYVKRAIRK